MTDDSITLATRLGDRLREADATLAVAESCTGGLIGGAITVVPGSSAYFYAGLTTYGYDAKRRQLGVSREALDTAGAVSDTVAGEMARGVRDVCDVTWGLSVTGVAGPTGGTESKPVGTVYIGVAYAGPWGSDRSFSSVSRHNFSGDRQEVREATVEAALAELIAAIDADGH